MEHNGQSIKNSEDQRGLTISLLHYIDTRFADKEKAIDEKTHAMDSRLATMNEFRDTVTDVNNRKVDKDAFSSWQDGVNKDLRTLMESRAELNGKANQSQVIGAYILGASGLILGIIKLFMK